MLAAEFGQGAPQFRLENDDQSDGEKNGKAAQEPTDDVEVEKLGSQGEADEDEGETDENFRARGTAEIQVPVVEQHGEQHDLHRAGPTGADKFNDRLHRCPFCLLPGPGASAQSAGAVDFASGFGDRPSVICP